MTGRAEGKECMKARAWKHPILVGLAAASAAVVSWSVAGLPQALAEAQKPRGLAVIIGNGEYRSRDIPPVDYAGRDAEAFRRYVVDVLGFDGANVIHLRNATKREMLDVLGDPASVMNDVQARLNILGAEGGVDVVVYYSGHGVPGRDGKPFLLPVDVPPHAARAEGYPIDLLYRMMGRLRGAKSVRVFLDTCFSGSSDGGRLVTGSPVYQETAFPETVADRMMVMTAVTKTQIATWDKEAKHGLFTHYLLDALYGKADGDGDGRVTGVEAKEYLDRHMTAAAWLLNRREQQATLRGTVGSVLARADGNGIWLERPALEGASGPEQAGTEAGPGVSSSQDDTSSKPADHAGVEAGLALKREGKALIQMGLAAMKYEVGYADGLFGKRTRGAIRKWQEAKGFDGTGYLTGEQAEALKAVGEGLRREREERERKAGEKAKQEREAREGLERERLAREAKERKEAERKVKEQAERERMRPGEVFRDCEGCPEMVVVPAGSFMMGSPRDELHRIDNEGPRHRVRIPRGFGVGKYEVTFDEWDACVAGGGCRGHRPEDEGWGGGRRPVINVNWEDAKAYVEYLSAKTGKEYRLLTEAEWEYAARAGTTGPFHTGSTITTGQANYNGSRHRNRTVSVGTFRANGFGLHDVHGNVLEWVEDCRHGSYGGAPTDGSAWVSGGDCSKRMLRGGSWANAPEDVRSAIRYWIPATDRSLIGGFRIARTLTP